VIRHSADFVFSTYSDDIAHRGAEKPDYRADASESDASEVSDMSELVHNHI